MTQVQKQMSDPGIHKRAAFEIKGIATKMRLPGPYSGECIGFHTGHADAVGIKGILIECLLRCFRKGRRWFCLAILTGKQARHAYPKYTSKKKGHRWKKT